MLSTSSGWSAPARWSTALRGLLILLATSGLFYSHLVAWTLWQTRDLSNAPHLVNALPWLAGLGLDSRPTYLALAELLPEQEKEYLEKAVEGEHPPLDALVRVSLLEEFAGEHDRALEAMDAALKRARSYKVFVAAASQAARLGLEDRVLEIAAKGLAFAPSAADDLFLLLQPLPRAELSLAHAKVEQRVDYLRFLIGQKDYLRALEYQASLPKGETVQRLRRELTERLILLREWEAVDRLYPPGAKGIQNADFDQEPTSLAFDWRLAQGDWIRMEWRPGTLTLQVQASIEEREVLSQYVRVEAGKSLSLRALGSGDWAQFRWRVEGLSPHWVRVALLAKPGGAKQVQLNRVLWGPDGE